MNTSTNSLTVGERLTFTALIALAPALPAHAQSSDERIAILESAVARLQATVAIQAKQIAVLQDKLAHFSRDGDDVFITGANLHIVNGQGSTDTTNSVGNLIVGYGEERGNATDDRSGSHNVVVGPFHNFSRFGGVVAGFRNEISGDYSSATGGSNNSASGDLSSVSGGIGNRAIGRSSSVSGGSFGTALEDSCSVSGGSGNEASGFASSVSGGVAARASGRYATVSGGTRNSATGIASSVSGGSTNSADGVASSASGGRNRTASDTNNWVAGDLFQPN